MAKRRPTSTYQLPGGRTVDLKSAQTAATHALLDSGHTDAHWIVRDALGAALLDIRETLLADLAKKAADEGEEHVANWLGCEIAPARAAAEPSE